MAHSYLRHPDNFFAGTRALTLEQRGAYGDILDLYISFDGLLPDDETKMARLLSVDPRIWRRIRGELLACGKIELRDSFVVPRGGDTTLGKSLASSEAGTKAAATRWANHRKNNKKPHAVAMPSNQIKSNHKSNQEDFSKNGGKGNGGDELHLVERDYIAAREKAPGWDVYFLEAEWRKFNLGKESEIRNTGAAFAGFCEKFARNNKL